MLGADGDSRLMLRVRAGDLSALGEIYDQYRLQVFQVALAITRDRQAAEEILRDCFVNLHARVDVIDRDAPIAPWLYRVASELSYLWVTRNSKWWTSLEGLIDRFDRLVAPARAGERRKLELHALQESVDRAIESLPFNQRIVVILYYVGGLSLKEIAYVLACPIGTAKSRLHYGRETLRRHFDAEAGLPQRPVARELAPTPS